MLQSGRNPVERMLLYTKARTVALALVRVFVVRSNAKASQSRSFRKPMSTLLSKGALLVSVCLLVPSSVLIGFLKTAPVLAAPATTLNFQARLLSNTGSLVADGNYNVQFNLYTVNSGGSTQWTDTRLVNATQGIIVKNGFMSVALGDTSAGGTAFPGTINWDQEQWLGMTVRGTNSCTPFSSCATPADSEMTPRFKLTAVPFAFSAANVNSGSTSLANTPSANVSIASGNASGTGASSVSGNISIDAGTSSNSTTGTISLGGTNASALTIGRATVSTTLQGNVSVTGGTNNGVYYRNSSNNLATTAAGTTGQCLVAATGEIGRASCRERV